MNYSGRKSLKKRAYDILMVSKNPGDLSWYFDIFIITLIILNVIAIILESVVSIKSTYSGFFKIFELVSVIIFTIEYLLRIWTATENPKYGTRFFGRLKYAATPLAIIDFLAILPFFLPLIGVDLRSLRILRLFRLFRLFKISRYVKALSLINQVFRDKREELVISLVFTCLMLLVTSSVMYYVENSAQPENFSSIPQTMWWGIATLTTVGYGDVYPITMLGKLLGGVIAVLGVGLFALPAGILASGFSDVISKRQEEPQKCPHCHKEIE